MTSTLLVPLPLTEGPDQPARGGPGAPAVGLPGWKWALPCAPGGHRAGLLLALALLSTGCASLTPPPRQGMNLRYTPRETPGPASAQESGVEAPRALATRPESKAAERLHRRRASREEVTAVGPDSADGAARQSALAAQLAFRGALLDVSGSTRRISAELSRLRASKWGLAGETADLFVPYVDYGDQQLRWIDAQLAAATRLANTATRLANTASQVEDLDMQLALLRMAGPRLEAAMTGSLLLAVWLDFLQLADTVLARHLYSVEIFHACCSPRHSPLWTRHGLTGARPP
ncbi:MAG: hypothetical protein ACXU86_22285, partial [Archangium sp.]